MRKHIWVAIAITLIFSACGAPPQVLVKDWPMKDKDATGNRVFVKDENFEYPITNVIAWKQQLIEPTQPIVADGKVFVACTTNKDEKGNRRALNCFDAFTGKLLWSEKYVLGNCPVFSNGNLIFQQGDETIICLDCQTRKKVWTNKVISGWHAYAIVDNGCFVLGGDKAITCFDEKTGKKLWEKIVKKDCRDTIVSSNGRLYYKILKQLFCVNLSDGKEIWKLENPDYIRNFVAYGDNLFYDTSSMLYCLDKDSEESWKFEYSKFSDGPGLTYCIFENKIYVAGNRSNLCCLNAYTGKEIFEQDKIYHHSGITYFDQRIFFCDSYGMARQSLAEEGKTERLELIKESSLAFSTSYSMAYGNIYFTSEKYGLLCINATTGTNAIAFKQSQTNPVQILESDKYWVGDLETDVRIFNKDKLVWKNDKEVIPFKLADGKIIKYFENEKNLVFLGYDNEAKIVCADKTSGKNIWTKPLGKFIITGFDNKTITLADNFGNLQMVDVTSGKTDTKKLAPNREGLGEFTDFEISLIIAPRRFSFKKINDHQYLIQNYYVARNHGSGVTDIFITNDDGSVIYQYEVNQDWGHPYFEEIVASNDKLYFRIIYYNEGKETKISTEVDLTTGEEKSYSEGSLPKDAISISNNFESALDSQKELLIKLRYESPIESMTNADFLKRTGIVPKKIDHTYGDGEKPEVSNGLLNFNNINICYRYISSYSSSSIDFVGAYDSKTWKKIWSQDGCNEFYFLGDKYLIVDDGNVRIVNLVTGKVVYELENTQVSSFVGDLLFATQRNQKNLNYAVIKAVNLKKIVEKFK